MGITILIIVVAVVIIIILREVWIWYWKIDKIIQNQQMTNHLLRVLIKNQQPAEGAKSSDVSVPDTSTARIPDLHTLPTQVWKPDVKKFRQQKRVGIILSSFGIVFIILDVLVWIGDGYFNFALSIIGLPLLIAGLVTFFLGQSDERKYRKQT